MPDTLGILTRDIFSHRNLATRAKCSAVAPTSFIGGSCNQTTDILELAHRQGGRCGITSGYLSSLGAKLSNPFLLYGIRVSMRGVATSLGSGINSPNVMLFPAGSKHTVTLSSASTYRASSLLIIRG